MTNNNRFWILTCAFVSVFALMLGLASCSNDNEEDLFSSQTDIVFEDVSYANDVLPIINTNCAVSGCHAGPTGAAGVVIDDYIQLKALVDDDRLVNVINNTNNYSLMPPSGLADSSIALIEQWVIEGAEEN